MEDIGLGPEEALERCHATTTDMGSKLGMSAPQN